MRYGQLLEKLTKYGLSEVSRMRVERDGVVDDIAHIGRPEEAIVPFKFPMHAIYLDAGADSEVDDEVIEALLRRFGISDKDFEGPKH
jgi:hypothetical protein